MTLCQNDGITTVKVQRGCARGESTTLNNLASAGRGGRNSFASSRTRQELNARSQAGTLGIRTLE